MCKPWILQRLDLHMYVDVILFVRCKENHTICNVYINLTQPMFGSCFTSCLVEGACLNYVNCVCVCVCIGVSLQSQEILNRPVCVLDILKGLKILKITKNFEKILNITKNSENCWKFLKLLKILNRFWTLLKILNRFWTLLNILNRFWKFLKLLKILNRFWTLLKILNIAENSEQILNIIFLLKSIYFTSFSLDFLTKYRMWYFTN